LHDPDELQRARHTRIIAFVLTLPALAVVEARPGAATRHLKNAC
jgi:hypothetical protein